MTDEDDEKDLPTWLVAANRIHTVMVGVTGECGDGPNGDTPLCMTIAEYLKDEGVLPDD